MSPEEIRKAYNAKVSQRSTLDNILDLIERFVVPFRGDYYNDERSEHEVEWRKREIYDSTAVMAAQVLAASIQGGLFSSSYRWFEPYYEVSELNKDVEAKEWLESVANLIYKELQDSNFDTEASEFCLDLVSFATSTIIEEESDNTIEKWEGINFKCVNNRDSYFDLDADDNIVRWFRRLMWNPVKIIQKFGREGVPLKITEAYDNDRMDQNFEIIFCIYLREENKNADTSKVLGPEARPYGAKYVMHDESIQLGKDKGYYEMPAFISKWRRTAGSDQGHGPAFVALSDILTLNELVEETLNALGKVVDPSTMVTERGLLSDLDLGAGGLTVVRSKDDIWVHESKARFDVGELSKNNLQESIRQAFYVDQLQLKDSPAMTATEVQVRYELMQRLIGPTYGSVKHNFLDKCVIRTFNILHRAGRLPPMPQSVIDSQSEIKIEYTGPIPRSQQLDTVRSVREWVAGIAGLSEIKPEILDNVDFDKLAVQSATKSGVPAELLNTKDEILKVRRQRRQDEARAKEAAMTEAEGKALKAAGEGADAASGRLGGSQQ